MVTVPELASAGQIIRTGECPQQWQELLLEDFRHPIDAIDVEKPASRLLILTGILKAEEFVLDLITEIVIIKS